MPILNVLNKNDLENTCAIVVRYFGGIKLGTGGLIRAYGGAVSDCLKKATLVKDEIYQKYELKLSYELSNKIDYYLKNNSIILDIKYTDEVIYIFALDNEDKIEKIKEFTKGISPINVGEETIQKVVK